MYNIPSSWKGIIAPFVVPGGTSPFINEASNKKNILIYNDEYGEKKSTAILYKMRFLSPLSAMRFASYEASLQDIKKFQNLDIEYLIHQAVVEYGGLLRSSYYN